MAQIWCGIVAFCVLSLFINILLTIYTSPGNIPADREWDMPEAVVKQDGQQN